MRRLLLLVGVLVIAALANFLGIPVAEATTCNTVCIAANLVCTPITSCTSVPSTSITCDGTTTTCADADDWCKCIIECQADFEDCMPLCQLGWQNCINNCGTRPPFIQGCHV